MRNLLILATTALALLPTAPPAAATSYSYEQFSLMTTRHAGQYWQNGAPAGQWSWSPNPDNTTDVSWGDPANWPPATFEHFTSDDQWVYLLGYSDRTTGEYLPQVVDSERIGDVNCAHMTALATDGRQKYVKRTIPGSAYCLDTTGHLDYHGQRIDFRHLQVWFPPSGPTCTTEYYSNQVCLKQFEQYWDNNGAPGSPLGMRVWRDQIEALGHGQAFIVHSYLPADHGWEAHLRYDWTW